MPMAYLLSLETEQIPLLQRLAREIWEEHYLPIIGQNQIDYMLDKFYSTEIIQQEIDSGISWEILWKDQQAIGYLVCEVHPTHLALQKIYLKKSARGNNYGQWMVERAKSLAKLHQKKRIQLTVNKNNTSSIEFYKAMGFTSIQSAIFDIGNGYVMDDFIFELDLA